MPKKGLFTDKEISVLKVLWDTEEPLSRPQILERTTDQELNPNTFHFSLNRLIEKGYIAVAGVARCGMNYGRTYTAVKSRGDYIFDVARDTLPEVSEETNVAELMAAFVERAQISEKTIEELEAMLAKRRKELEQAEREAKEEAGE